MRTKDKFVYDCMIYRRWEDGFQLSHTPTHTFQRACVGMLVHVLAHMNILALLLRSRRHKLTTMTDDVFIQLLQSGVHS